MPSKPLLSVIVPAYQGATVLPKSLGGLAASDLPKEFWELIVVDDASTDATAEVAARFADTVVRLTGKPHGPSYARNRGFEVARGEILVFIDADVCVHPDTLRRFAWKLAASEDVAAVFGSYDNAPPAQGVVSQYRNLLHHFMHQQNPGEAETFWAGCGALRRAIFAEAGMYDEWQFFRPQIEDIELGHRIRDRGYRILLCPEIQGTHLKRWTLRNVVQTDITDRGVPWSRLLIRRGAATSSNALNLAFMEKVNTGLAWLALSSIGLTIVQLDGRWLALAALFLVPILLANWRLYDFFRRLRGLGFAVACLPMHLLYYLLNGVSFGVGWVLHHTVGDATPAAAIQAFSELGVEKWPPVPKQNR